MNENGSNTAIEGLYKGFMLLATIAIKLKVGGKFARFQCMRLYIGASAFQASLFHARLA